jgi:hypothetical protein
MTQAFPMDMRNGLIDDLLTDLEIRDPEHFEKIASRILFSQREREQARENLAAKVSKDSAKVDIEKLSNLF